MDTVDFLRKILPEQGVYVFSVIRPHPSIPGKTQTANAACATVDQLAARILLTDKHPEHNIYHACASFVDGTLPPNQGLRKATNAGWVRAQWVDIDVGPGEKKYPTLTAAVKAVQAFCIEHRLNAPLLVSSGRGLHAYWTFTEDVPAAEAVVSARAFQIAAQEAGFKIDPARTADLASILRPVGSHWKKDGSVEVKVLHPGTKPMRFEAFRSRFAQYEGLTKAAAQAVDDEFGTGPREYPPSSAHEIVKHCAALQDAREQGMAIEEPLWRTMLGLLKHTVEGDAIAHEWSQGDPRYTHSETQAKLDYWSAGPPTCETIKSHGGSCTDCPHTARRSPINLGFVVQEPQPPKEPVMPPAPPADHLKYAKKLPHELKGIWNNHYTYLNGSLGTMEADPDGGPPIHTPFCLKYVYPYAYIRREDGTYEVGFYSYTESRGVWDEFTIPAEYLGDVRRLRSALASHKVYLTGEKGPKIMLAFVQDLLQPLEAQGIESLQINHFGWTKDGFILGDTLITKDGERPVVLGPKVPDLLKGGFQCKGSAMDAAQSLMHLYRRPGSEIVQFAILAALASPLVKLMNSDLFHGIPLGLTGQSGLGKTTIAMMACSLFTKPDSILINASDMGTTTNAMIQMNATVSNLPMIFDELHAMKEGDMPTLLYALSNGKPKFRLTQSSTFNETGTRWDNITFVTSNSNISAALATQERDKAEATQLRLWEVVVPPDFMKVYDTRETKGMIDDHLGNYYGTFGREYIHYVVKNKEKIDGQIRRMRAKYVPNSQEMTRERYYYDFLTCVMVARDIAEKLGLVFDAAPLEAWALSHIRTMRHVRGNNLASYHEQIHAVLSLSAGRVVKSATIPRARVVVKDHVDATIAPVGRHFVNDNVLAFSTSGLQEICRELRINYTNLVNEMEFHGVLKHKEWIGLDKRGRVALFKGTDLPNAYAQTKVVVIDLSTLGADEESTADEPHVIAPATDETRQIVH